MSHAPLRLFPVIAALSLAACDLPPTDTSEPSAGSPDDVEQVTQALTGDPTPILAATVVATGTDVGKVGGDVGVTPNGQVTYRLPLWAAPGVEGIGPDLGLSYSSSGRGGYAGVGWSLTGAGSEIVRCARTKAIDGGENEAVILGAGEPLCLDGNRLVLVAGQHEQAGAEYRTYSDTFVKVVVKEAGTLGPNVIQVFEKSGRIRTYSTPLRGRAVHTFDWSQRSTPPVSYTAWYGLLQSRVEDRAGNRMDIEWTGTTSTVDGVALEPRPVRISYTSRSGVSARRKVEFQYARAGTPYLTRRYVAGLAFEHAMLLQSVTMFAPNPSATGVVRKYKLTYAQSPTTSRWLLSRAQECDGDPDATTPPPRPVACKRPTQFTYETGTAEFVQATAGFTDATHPGYEKYWSIIPADINGDGKDDYFFRYGQLWNFRLARVDSATGKVSFGPATEISVALDLVDDHPWDLVPVDFDRDGKIDIATVRMNGTVPYYAYYLGNGAGGFTPIADSQEQAGITATAGLEIGDMTGDGRPDVLRPLDGSAGQTWGLREFRSSKTLASSFTPMSTCTYDAPVDGKLKAWNAHLADVDGNGRPDMVTLPTDNLGAGDFLVSVQGAGLGWIPSPLTLMASTEQKQRRYAFGDFTGDGLPDALEFIQGEAVPFLRVNMGGNFLPALMQLAMAGTEASVEIGARYEDANDLGMRFMDYNLDGIQDILLVDNGAARDSSAAPAAVRSNLIALVSGPGGFFDPQRLSIPVGQPANGADEHFTGQLANWKTSQVLDVNGDGLTDIVQVEAGQVKVYVRKGKKPDLLVRVTDGMGERTDLVWKPMTDPAVYTAGSDCAFPQICVGSGAWVVAQRRDDNGIGTGQSRRDYAYSDARVDVHGAGWLGFGQRTVTDPQRSTSITETYDNTTSQTLNGVRSYVFLGLETARATTVHLAGGTERRLVSRSSDYERVSSAGGKVFWTRPTKVREVHQESPTYDIIRDVETTYEYRPEEADVGTFRQQTVTSRFNNGTKQVDRTYAQYQHDRVKWLVGLPKRVEISSQAPDLRIVKRVQAFEYNATTGLMTAHVTEPEGGNDHYLRTTFTRNTKGQITKIVATDKLAVSRSDTIEYDPYDGVFPMKTTNKLGHTTVALRHPALGVVRLQETPAGVQTLYQYDGFGRERAISWPGGGGTRTTYVRGTEAGSTTFGTLEVMTERLGGGKTRVFYNHIGQQIEQRIKNLDNTYSVVKSRYDSRGFRTGVTLPAKEGTTPAGTTTHEYDNLGRQTATRRPDEAASGGVALSTWIYSLRTQTHTDEVGHKTKTLVDELGRPIRTAVVSSAGEIPTEYRYGPFGLLEKVTRKNVAGTKTVVTAIEYDIWGRRTKLLDADSRTTEYQTNAFGDLRRSVDANAKETRLEYDGAGRLFRKTDLDGVTTFTYDTAPNGKGLLAKATSPDGVAVTYEYDVFGRPTREAQTLGTVTSDVRSTYDANGRLDVLEYPALPDASRLKVKHTYDADNGELSKVADVATGRRFWQGLERNGALQLTKEAFGNDAQTVRGYLAKSLRLNRIETTKLSGTVTSTLQKLGYDYYADGSLKRRRDVLAAQHEGFDYDALDRLQRWYPTDAAGVRNTASWQVSWAYDEFGNLTGRNYAAGNVTGATAQNLKYQYAGLRNAGPHAVTTSPFGDYSYDRKGNQIGRPGGETITYTAFNLPRTITAGTASTSFQYDAFGRRALKRASSTKQTRYIGDVYERRTNGTTDEHVHFVRGGAGKLVAHVMLPFMGTKKGTARVAYLHNDRLGTAESLTDASGKVIERLKTDPFGNRVTDFNRPLLAIASRFTQPARGSGVTRGFTGHEEDDELGLINMRGRMYDPRLGRFLSTDPYVQSPMNGQSYNRYAYVFNNPLKWVDPTGGSGEELIEGISAQDCKESGGQVQAGGCLLTLERVTVYEDAPTEDDEGSCMADLMSCMDSGRDTDDMTTGGDGGGGGGGATHVKSPTAGSDGQGTQQPTEPEAPSKAEPPAAPKNPQAPPLEPGLKPSFLQLDDLSPKLLFKLGAAIVVGLGKMAGTEVSERVLRGGAEEAAERILPRETTSLVDGAEMGTSDALNAAGNFLGTNVKEVAPGVFKSADGKAMVRMTDSDLAKVGNHAGSPHMNFQTGTTVTKPNGKERFIPEDNKHIYLPEER